MKIPARHRRVGEAPGRVGRWPALLALLATTALLLAGCGPGEVRAADEGASDDLRSGASTVAAGPASRAPAADAANGPPRTGTAVSTPMPAADSTPGGHDHGQHGEGPAAGAPSEHSIYHVGGSWRNRFGDDVGLGDLGGRVQLVALVYTSCSYACPRIIATMKRIEGALGPDYADRVGFTLVSIDPERDVPERLRRFGEQSRLDSERWTLLNGGDGDVLALSVLLGVKYRATGDGEFAHSNVITVLDPGGVVVHRIEGLRAPVDPALEAIRRVAP